MSNMNRIFWIWFILLFLHGCSGYRSLRIPGGETTPGGKTEEMPIRVNDKIRITQLDEKQVEGVVSQIRSEGIELIQNGDTENARWVSYAEMGKLELFENDHPVRSLGLAAAVVGGVVVGYIIVENRGPTFSPDAAGK